MRVFKTRWFTRFARQEGIDDRSLVDAVAEIERGLYEAGLGSGLIKKRVARTGEGKSGGYRTIVAYHEGKRAVFLYGFPKNGKDNLTQPEEKGYRKVARIYLHLSDAAIAGDLKTGALTEVTYGRKKI